MKFLPKTMKLLPSSLKTFTTETFLLRHDWQIYLFNPGQIPIVWLFTL